MEAYIVGGYRSAVAKAPKGKFRFTRPDDIAAEVIKKLMADFQQVPLTEIDDVIVGNAFPESEAGLNMGRMLSLLSLGIIDVPGSTINRYCASGVESIAIATAKIRAGLSDIILAGGAESMSLIAMGGWRSVPNPDLAHKNPEYYHSMGLTAEAVATEYNISREEQDVFSLESHNKALAALNTNKFQSQIIPVTVTENYIAENGKKATRQYIVNTDEGPRPSTLEALSKLKPVFSANGTVTAGNSSQMSDGAAFVLIMSENAIKRYNIKPIARLLDYQVGAVPPYKMGVGPIVAIPKVLEHSGLKLHQIEQIELNEAFASQALAVVKTLNLNPAIINVNGGAIALGHPLGATGTKLTVQLLNEMRLKNQKYGIVSMCIGGGQGAAAIFELL